MKAEKEDADQIVCLRMNCFLRPSWYSQNYWYLPKLVMWTVRHVSDTESTYS